jgi:hypothetical protein
MGVKRYDLNYCEQKNELGLFESPDGDYILYEDHEEVECSLRSQIRDLQNERIILLNELRISRNKGR